MKPFACTPADAKPITASPGSIVAAVDRAGPRRRRRRRCRRSRARPRGRSRAARPSRRRRARRRPRGRPRPRPRRAPRPRSRSIVVRGDVVEQDQRRRRRYVATSLMQCAARSAPQSRSAPRCRASISFVPTPSVEAASSRPSSSGWSPAKAPNPVAPVDSTAARSRSTIAVGVASETPAGRVAVRLRAQAVRVYEAARRERVRRTARRASSGRPSGPPGEEPDDRVCPTSTASAVGRRGRGCRRARRPSPSGSSARSCSSASSSSSLAVEQVVDPRRAADAPRAGSRRSSRRTCAGRRAPGRAGSSSSRARAPPGTSSSSSATPRWSTRGTPPVARLDDDVHRAALELRQPQLEARRGRARSHEIPGSTVTCVVADRARSGATSSNAELADVAGLDVADLARHEVVVEEVHGSIVSRRPSFVQDTRGVLLARRHQLEPRAAAARADASSRRCSTCAARGRSRAAASRCPAGGSSLFWLGIVLVVARARTRRSTSSARSTSSSST